MVKFDFYAIYVETSERSGEVVDVFSSFEECIEHRMEHANWFCPKGDIWILHINNGKNFKPYKQKEGVKHGKRINRLYSRSRN